ncbi:ATP-binding cassette domain-containing protein [Altericista sp. CCNU0014]|uniref:ATP-binding cassette domain-containing protein n=1 Tax=Altericista sp. CCNU0014 TaxID=3082949 RepID=UPI003851351F
MVLARLQRLEDRNLQEVFLVTPRTRLTIGQNRSNLLVLNHPSILPFHAIVFWLGDGFAVEKKHPAAEVWVNQHSLLPDSPYGLSSGDRIRIGGVTLTFNLDAFASASVEPNPSPEPSRDALHNRTSTPSLSQPAPTAPIHRLRLDACDLVYRVGGLKLLDDISLSILPTEFVTIVGVSGAGKSTLLNALCGFRPATRGSVFVNGDSLYQNYDAYRNELGYVPQDDIIHEDLTVQQALSFAAQLRLSPHTTEADRQQQVHQVLLDLELREQANTIVKNLSGGQRKRVSIGVELLTKPGLFFLDEATSGLDPGTELQMMRLLRRMASQGRTVVLVTHTTKNLAIGDLVVFLAKGGRVAYFGPPKDALDYFGVEEFDEIYIKVEEERSPQEWALQYQQSLYYQKYVADRQISLLEVQSSPDIAPLPTELRQSLKPSPWRQFRILSKRSLTILRQDRPSFFFLLAVAPILGILDFVMWRRDMFDSDTGDPSQCFTLLFITVLIAVIVGSLSTMREVVKESEIYRRERMIGLQIVPYVLSKVSLSAILALYQSAIFISTKAIAVDFPGTWETGFYIYITLFLSTLGGMVMGLLVSALSTSQNMAPLLTILFLVPQITFAGSFLPLRTLGPAGQAISQLTITRWAYESMVTLSGIGRDVARDPCWKQPDSVRKAWKDADKVSCQCMGPQLFDRCEFPSLHLEYDPAVSQPEPLKPKSPGDPPAAPENLLLEATQFSDDLTAYSDKTKVYRKELDAWQTRFSQWKEKRGRAIAAAEELLNRFNRNQGDAFAVNFVRHWVKLGLLILAMLSILIGVQKRKDWV